VFRGRLRREFVLVKAFSSFKVTEWIPSDTCLFPRICCKHWGSLPSDEKGRVRSASPVQLPAAASVSAISLGRYAVFLCVTKGKMHIRGRRLYNYPSPGVAANLWLVRVANRRMNPDV